ncbi:hypothetical protein [Deinococcus multiflagellatus]|uniref:Uncharacterized protein n=1 Tax=Deinococcus multiflagellatus TaxID=1656887 RepID=A0ABW1ZNX8_9DEIO|nr:hypothetical protein [Deinococcus multiflagellatus]MBZ9715768.1 hypothetical protein [Deinococcus multiflagellatus]
MKLLSLLLVLSVSVASAHTSNKQVVALGNDIIIIQPVVTPGGSNTRLEGNDTIGVTP